MFCPSLVCIICYKNTCFSQLCSGIEAMRVLEKRCFTRATCGSLRVYSGYVLTEYGRLDFEKLVKNDKEIRFAQKDFDWFGNVLLRNKKSCLRSSYRKFKFQPPCCLKNYTIQKKSGGKNTVIEITA